MTWQEASLLMAAAAHFAYMQSQASAAGQERQLNLYHAFEWVSPVLYIYAVYLYSHNIATKRPIGTGRENAAPSVMAMHHA